MTNPMLIDRQEVEEAFELISALQGRGVLNKTPLVRSRSLSNDIGRDVFLKLENQQVTRSFKPRGAFNAVSLALAKGARKVFAASAGNHAQGIALAGRELGVEVIVVMPKAASPLKQTRTRALGADVLLSGDNLSEAIAVAMDMAQAEVGEFVGPYADRGVIAGQATLGVEIAKQASELGLNAPTVVIPLGGGGLASGIGVGLSMFPPRGGARAVAIEARTCNSYEQIRLGSSPQHDEPIETIADGTAIRDTYPIIQAHLDAYVDAILSVDDTAIANAVLWLLETEGHVAEPSGAKAVAAIAAHTEWFLKRGSDPLVLLLSGGNLDLFASFDRIRALSETDRRVA